MSNDHKKILLHLPEVVKSWIGVQTGCGGRKKILSLELRGSVATASISAGRAIVESPATGGKCMFRTGSHAYDVIRDSGYSFMNSR